MSQVRTALLYSMRPDHVSNCRLPEVITIEKFKKLSVQKMAAYERWSPTMEAPTIAI